LRRRCFASQPKLPYFRSESSRSNLRFAVEVISTSLGMHDDQPPPTSPPPGYRMGPPIWTTHSNPLNRFEIVEPGGTSGFRTGRRKFLQCANLQCYLRCHAEACTSAQ
jgi:hypothetical protein